MSIAAAGTIGGRHLPLRIQVRDELRERIATGELAPGVRLIERDLATQLGVSRVPVREAIRMLEAEGLVRTVPRKGVVVDTMSRRDVEELFDVREALEVMGCRRAAERGSEEGFHELEDLLAEARTAITVGDAVRIAKANAAFHEQITVLADNRTLASVMEPVRSRMRWLFAQTDDPGHTVEEHEQMYAAIVSRDAAAAAACAAEHVQANREHVLAMLFEEPDPAL
jgi:DNA-binding GntR family transcriptional regulator